MKVFPVPVAIARIIWRFRLANRVFCRGIRVPLVRANKRVIIRREENLAKRSFEIEGEKSAERLRRVEVRDLPRTVQIAADIMVPDHFAVRGIEKRSAKAAKNNRARRDPTRVPISLAQYVLRAEAELLCFNDPENLTCCANRVIGRAMVGRIFLNGAAIEFRKRGVRCERHHAPAGRAEARVDKLLAREPFRVLWRGGGHRFHNSAFPGRRSPHDFPRNMLEKVVV